MLDDLKKKVPNVDGSFLQDVSDEVMLNLKDSTITTLRIGGDRCQHIRTDKSTERSVIWFYELDQLPDGANIHIR